MSDYAGKGPQGRKLVAVVHADMVGYSRLIGLDDVGTLVRWRTLRKQLFDPTIERFGGHVFQTAGDSLLIIFDSVTDAVSCAVELQRELPSHDAGHPVDRRIQFRMGVDLGDIIAEGTDLHGNGVNVAARLQAECPPGHVCVSRTVRDHVIDRLDLDFDAHGPLTLRNIVRPVEAFVVRTEHTPRPVDSPVAKPAAESAQPQRFSLVVLPFTNLGGIPGDDHLIDAISDDLTTELSRIAGHLVIARTSAAAYKGRLIDAKRVGEELGVYYVVEGSARKLGNSLRVNVQLISAPANTRLWGDRFEQDLTDAGAGLEQIIRRLTAVLDIQILDAEITRGARERPGTPDAYDRVMRSWAAWRRPHTPELLLEISESLEEALRLDPDLVPAMQGLANWLTYRFGGFPDSLDWGKTELIERAAALLSRGLGLKPNDDELNLAQVRTLRVAGRWLDAVAACQRLLGLHPNFGLAHRELGCCTISAGRPAEAISLFHSMIRLDPLSNLNPANYGMIGRCHLLLGHCAEAIEWLSRSLTEAPDGHWLARATQLFYLASAYSLNDDEERGRRALAQAVQLWPSATVHSLLPGLEPRGLPSPAYAALFHHVQQGLRIAGLREHAPEDIDFGISPSSTLLVGIDGPTPTVVPGAATIHTSELVRLIENRPLLIDDAVGSWGRSLAGAIGLQGAGHGAAMSNDLQARLMRTIGSLTGGKLQMPIVVFSINSERFAGYNLALRLVALGYTNVYWYRGGLEAWRAHQLPDAEVKLHNW